MAKQATDPALARAAWSELYSRHVRYLFAVISRTYGRSLRDEGTADLVADTFRRAFEWAAKQPDPDSVAARFFDADLDVVRRKVLSWLSAIAERLFQDRIRRRPSTAEEIEVAIENWKGRFASGRPPAPSEKLTRLQAALNHLSAEEGEALRLSLPWYDAHLGEFAFPRGGAADVARQLGISADTFRQRRYRALGHIETHMRHNAISSIEVDRGAAAACFVGQTFHDLYASVAPIFCGGGTDGGAADAAGD